MHKCKLTDMRRRLCSNQMFLRISKLLTNVIVDCDTLWRCLCDYANRFRRLHYKLSVENRTVGLEWRLVLCGWGGYVLCLCAGWTAHLYSFSHSLLNLWLLFCVCKCVKVWVCCRLRWCTSVFLCCWLRSFACMYFSQSNTVCMFVIITSHHANCLSPCIFLSCIQ